jgi:integrase
MLFVCDVVGAYLKHCEREGVHCEEARYDRSITFRWFCQAMGHLPVEELRAYHLTDWVDNHPRWKSVATRRAKASSVKAAFAWAARMERIKVNPFQNVRYREADRRPEMPDGLFDQTIRLANRQFAWALRWLRLTGCRCSELCRAKWADINEVRGLWTVPRHKSRRYTCRPKLVALVPEAMELLKELPRRCEYVFLNAHGKPWGKGSLPRALIRLRERFPELDAACSLHGIRHRMATEAIANGAPIKLIAEQLGHATTVITERSYYHASADHIDRVRDAASLGLPKKG